MLKYNTLLSYGEKNQLYNIYFTFLTNAPRLSVLELNSRRRPALGYTM